jgi:sugar O-acyltransferase (sialic acid O-acetyltransferase NeuD family)
MRLIIYGARDYADTVADLAIDCGHEVVGKVDDEGRSDDVLGRFSDVLRQRQDCGVVLGIGYRDLPARWAAWQRVRESGLPTPSLIHPRAYVARTAQVANGCVVMAGAIVDRVARLGEACVVWPGACVNHGTIVGENSFVSPNATLCGLVQLGAHCFVGAGAAIADRCRVPEGTSIRMLERYSLNRQT